MFNYAKLFSTMEYVRGELKGAGQTGEGWSWLNRATRKHLRWTGSEGSVGLVPTQLGAFVTMVILTESSTDISRREKHVFLKTVTHPGVACDPVSEPTYISYPRSKRSSSKKKKKVMNWLYSSETRAWRDAWSMKDQELKPLCAYYQ